MSGKNSKNNKVALDIYQVRTRKLEIAEGLFSCPFLSKRGAPCRVSQKYRSLKNHCKRFSGKMLKREERAAASAKLKAAALKKAFKKKQPAPVKPVVILLLKTLWFL